MHFLKLPVVASRGAIPASCLFLCMLRKQQNTTTCCLSMRTAASSCIRTESPLLGQKRGKSSVFFSEL